MFETKCSNLDSKGVHDGYDHQVSCVNPIVSRSLNVCDYKRKKIYITKIRSTFLEVLSIIRVKCLCLSL